MLMFDKQTNRHRGESTLSLSSSFILFLSFLSFSSLPFPIQYFLLVYFFFFSLIYLSISSFFLVFSIFLSLILVYFFLSFSLVYISFLPFVMISLDRNVFFSFSLQRQVRRRDPVDPKSIHSLFLSLLISLFLLNSFFFFLHFLFLSFSAQIRMILLFAKLA